MGVSGLHPIIKPICTQAHLSDFHGKRAAVDASSWLHKGAFSCARDLGYEKPTRRYIDYCIFRVKMMLHFGVRPTLVFDGAPLPMKAAENARRSTGRKEALQKAFDFDRKGDRKRADEMFQRAVCITHQMARELIKELRKIDGVEYIVAPYEADAQLAWLSINDKVDLVVTEDSDLIVYGALRIFYKMSKEGAGELCESKNLLMLENPNMRNFSPAMFTWVCVLSGCDFFDGIKGLGMRKAHEMVRRCRSLDRVLCRIRYDTRYTAPDDFPDAFHRACLVFRHQTVYDVDASANVHLTPLNGEARAGIPERIFVPTPSLGEDLDFIGHIHDSTTAARVASGMAHPTTLALYPDPLDAPMAPPRLPTSSVQRRNIQAPSVGDSSKNPTSCGFAVAAAGRSRHSKIAAKVVPAKPRPRVFSKYFQLGQPPPPAHIGSSQAVTEAFKPPSLIAVTGAPPQANEVCQVSTQNLSDTEKKKSVEPSQAKKEWLKRSLRQHHSTVGPSQTKRPHSSASSGVAKRQRTMLDMKMPNPPSRNRFANASLGGTKLIDAVRGSVSATPEIRDSGCQIASLVHGGQPDDRGEVPDSIDGIEIPDVPSSPEGGGSPVTPAGAPGLVEPLAMRTPAVPRSALSRRAPSGIMMARVAAAAAGTPRRSPRRHMSKTRT